VKKFLIIAVPLAAAMLIAIINPPVNNDGTCNCGTPLAGLFSLFGCSDAPRPQADNSAQSESLQESQTAAVAAQMQSPSGDAAEVTFVELGSINCIPCKMMQPVMRAVEEKFGSRIKIVFHDVWTNEGRPFAEKYGIRAIPTQVFLDRNGKEYFRHEGFFPQADVEKVLAKKGVK